MPSYREKVWPAAWIPIACLLVIPASVLTLTVVSTPLGVATGIVLYLACVALWAASAPVIEVADGSLRAGRASIPLELLGEAEAFTGDEGRLERGVRLDARAWLLIRGGVPDVVRVPVLDPEDPTPYWLVSTRHAREAAAAINGSRRPQGSGSAS